MSGRIAVLAAVALAGSVAALATFRDGAEGRRAPPVVKVSLIGAADAAETVTAFGVGRGRLVTVAHAFEAPRRLRVRPGGSAHLMRVDRSSDLALIVAPGLEAPPLRSSHAARGSARLLLRRDGRTLERVVVIRRRVRAGVRRAQGPRLRVPALELEATVARGDSGAPVVDSDGAVAGVLFAASNRRPGIAYAIDVSRVEALIDRGSPFSDMASGVPSRP